MSEELMTTEEALEAIEDWSSETVWTKIADLLRDGVSAGIGRSGVDFRIVILKGPSVIAKGEGATIDSASRALLRDLATSLT